MTTHTQASRALDDRLAEADWITLQKLAGSRNSMVRVAIATCSDTPSALLQKLAEDSDVDVRRYVAINPNTPPAILQKLAEDLDPIVRVVIATNPNTPSALFLKLAADSIEFVRRAVAENPHTSPDLLGVMALDENPGVQQSALSALQKAYPDTLALLLKLVGNVNKISCRVVAETPNMPPDLLRALARISSRPECFAKGIFQKNTRRSS
jgi:hypothetical protein